MPDRNPTEASFRFKVGKSTNKTIKNCENGKRRRKKLHAYFKSGEKCMAKKVLNRPIL